MKKWIIGIIFGGMLLGAAFSPSILAASTQRNLTVELSSLESNKSTTLALTESDFQNIKEILENADGKLRKAISNEEQYQVYTTAVNQLYQYGVFGNLTLTQAQRLVTYWYRTSSHIQTNTAVQSPVNRNVFCLVYGHTGFTYTGHRFTSWLQLGGWSLVTIGLMFGEPYVITPGVLFGLLLIVIGIAGISLGTALASRADVTPIAVGDIFGVGSAQTHEDEYAQGWVHTLGFLGNKNWSGELKGNLPGQFLFDLSIITYPAIWGFCGIKIWLNEDGSEKSYLGSAILVGLDQKAN